MIEKRRGIYWRNTVSAEKQIQENPAGDIELNHYSVRDLDVNH